MHGILRHRHPAGKIAKREEATLEDNNSLANLVEREAAAANNGVATVYSVVYVTASATFSGPTAGYVTVGLPTTSATAAAKSSSAKDDDNDETTTKTGKTTAATSVKSIKTTATVAPSAATSTHASATSGKASSVESHSSSSAASSSVVVSSSSAIIASSSTASSSVKSSASLAGAEATTSSKATSSASAAAASSGLSSGAKGGIAFAILLAVGVAVGLTFFCIRRKKEQRSNREGAQRLHDDEKRAPSPFSIPAVKVTAAPSDGPLAPPPAARTTSPAPRLSIRPTSGFSLGPDPEKAAASIAAVVTAAPYRPQSTRWPTSRPSSPAVRPGNPTTDPANPFGIHAETINAASSERVVSPTHMLRASESTASFELQGSPVPLTQVTSPVESSAAGRHASKPNSMSPTRAEFGVASALALGAAAGAQPLGNNVHRVQLEFLPSRDDELELKPGALVRIAHEYDDGWALCTSMDRTKQGVAPRTCLSKLPLKPRPTGPPSSGRPISPMGPPTQGMRKVSAPVQRSIPHNSLVPAPLSPAMNGRMSPAGPPTQQQRQRTASGPQSQLRSMSPGPSPSKPMADSRRRSASVGSFDKMPNPSAGPSPLNPLAMSAIPSRKPVPGQAI